MVPVPAENRIQLKEQGCFGGWGGVIPVLLFFVQTPYGDRKPTAHWGYPEPAVLRPQEDVGAGRAPGKEG